MSLFLYEQRGHVAILTFNRAETRNPLGAEGDGDEAAELCERINRDDNIRCVVLTGAGSAFSAGGNVKAMHGRSGEFGGPAEGIRERYRRGIHRMVLAFYNLQVPAIAAVNGPAIGLGCDVACLADVRIASEAAKFGVTFLKIGLIPGDGGAWLLPRTIGMSRASELLFTGDVIDARTAESWGLVSKVVPPEQLMEAAMEMANRIAQQPPYALRMAKSLLRHGRNTSFETLMEMSGTAQAISHITDDHAEGVAALLEKRRPKFSD